MNSGRWSKKPRPRFSIMSRNKNKTMRPNKLVRDLIPQLIEDNGDEAITKILDQEEYFEALKAKLQEEVEDYIENDDPEELYRTGEFNYCNVICLPNDEQIILFSKIGENIRHFLKVKNYGLKSQKKLASFHLRPEHAQEILDISHASPQKVKEVLAKYEKIYKPKKFWG